MMKSLVISGAVTVCAIAAYVATRPSDSVPYHAYDQCFVDKALALYSGNGKIPAKQIERDVFPVVVRFPGKVCVGLNAKRGVTGGDTTICFDKETSRLLSYDHDGD